MIFCFNDFLDKRAKIAVVGLGYVGMPLLYHMSKYFDCIGFDINKKRINELRNGIDNTGELEKDSFQNIKFTSDFKQISETRFIIITVPTPINTHKLPDLGTVINATELVGSYLVEGSIVVYESTVYPGVTEEICVPILEKVSNLKYNEDFFVGYSPERINPGDKMHTVDKIVKVVSSNNKYSLYIMAKIYGTITEAGVFLAKDIKTAEAAKVIENTQRDINIALMNELAMIFDKLNLDTKSVLEAASTKWNFLNFEPGLVGGHCIGVDPFYLTFKAQETGYYPEVILAGRRINDSMGIYIAQKAIKKMISKNKTILNTNVIVLGITFKENIPDIRNSKVVDIINELKDFGVNVDAYDPYADEEDVLREYNVNLSSRNKLKNKYDCVIVAVKHDVFIKSKRWILNLLNENGVLIDIKGIFEENDVGSGLCLWRLN